MIQVWPKIEDRFSWCGEFKDKAVVDVFPDFPPALLHQGILPHE